MNDLISRNAAVDAAVKMFGAWYGGSVQREREIRARFDALPSVLERKKGKWIDEPVYRQTMDGKTWDGYTYCSKCREMYEYGYRSKYCPNCGAEQNMRGEDDGTDEG